jgi:hypothetical protein
MTSMTLGMARVAKVAERMPLSVLAREAGVNYETVKTFRRRGWQAKSLSICEKLIAAAERLDPDGASA